MTVQRNAKNAAQCQEYSVVRGVQRSEMNAAQ